MEIRKAEPADLESVLDLHRAAFSSDDEPQLTRTLLEDPGAAPLISLVAEDEATVVGHILLTRASVASDPGVRAMMLAPLGVAPALQNRGIGSELTREALRWAGKMEIALIFLAGHPAFYPRFGFRTRATDLGFHPPAPMPEHHADAWMVAEIEPGTIGRVSGRVIPADELMNPKYWIE